MQVQMAGVYFAEYSRLLLQSQSQKVCDQLMVGIIIT